MRKSEYAVKENNCCLILKELGHNKEYELA